MFKIYLLFIKITITFFLNSLFKSKKIEFKNENKNENEIMEDLDYKKGKLCVKNEIK